MEEIITKERKLNLLMELKQLLHFLNIDSFKRYSFLIRFIYCHYILP